MSRLYEGYPGLYMQMLQNQLNLFRFLTGTIILNIWRSRKEDMNLRRTFMYRAILKCPSKKENPLYFLLPPPKVPPAGFKRNFNAELKHRIPKDSYQELPVKCCSAIYCQKERTVRRSKPDFPGTEPGEGIPLWPCRVLHLPPGNLTLPGGDRFHGGSA